LNLGFLTEDLKIRRRKFAAVSLFNLGSLAWFFLLLFYMSDIFASMTQNDPFWGYHNIGQILFFGFAIFWSITTSFIAGKVSRRKLLISSIFLGTFSTILMALLQGTISAAVLSLLAGMSLGLGLPSSMALVADYTVVEERARVSGTIIFGTFVTAILIIALIRILNLGVLGDLLLFAAVRATSFSALVIDKCDNPSPMLKKENRLTSTAYKEFFFYFFPWVMFGVASSLAWNLIPTTVYPTEIALGTTLRYVFIAVFGLVAGFMADRFGRKQPIIIGLIVLGVGFALLGFNFSGTTVIAYVALSGVTWGLFFVVFLAVPGDLSVVGSREKFYALGYILPLAGMFSLVAIPGPDLSPILKASSFAQLLSIILFLSIIPILRAKETLPKQKIQERKMKEHVKRIGKLLQKSKKENSRD
jgi:MFS family permease